MKSNISIIDREIDKQTDRHTDRPTDRQIDRKARRCNVRSADLQPASV